MKNLKYEIMRSCENCTLCEMKLLKREFIRTEIRTYVTEPVYKITKIINKVEPELISHTKIFVYNNNLLTLK